MSEPKGRREILEERARQLARPAGAAVAAGVETLTFSLGRERFAIESANVFAVFQLTELVPLPGATPPVVGLTRWRGDVLTILDVRRLVGSVTTALDDLNRVIVVGLTHPEFGVLADTVSDIVCIDLPSLHALPAERRADATLMHGVTGDAVHVINASALVARQADVHSAIDAVPPTPSSTS